MSHCLIAASTKIFCYKQLISFMYFLFKAEEQDTYFSAILGN